MKLASSFYAYSDSFSFFIFQYEDECGHDNAGGKKASLVVDKKRSDSTGTTFTNRKGYVMSAGFIDKNTHTTSEVVGVNAPNGSFLVKNCEPRPR